MKIVREILPYIGIILVVILIRTFIVTPVRVTGASMRPTLNDKEFLLLEKFNNKIERFDIVVSHIDIDITFSGIDINSYITVY